MQISFWILYVRSVLKDYVYTETYKGIMTNDHTATLLRKTLYPGVASRSSLTCFKKVQHYFYLTDNSKYTIPHH